VPVDVHTPLPQYPQETGNYYADPDPDYRTIVGSESSIVGRTVQVVKRLVGEFSRGESFRRQIVQKAKRPRDELAKWQKVQIPSIPSTSFVAGSHKNEPGRRDDTGTPSLGPVWHQVDRRDGLGAITVSDAGTP